MTAQDNANTLQSQCPKPVAETVSADNAPADTRECPECGEMLAHHHGSAAYPECWYCTDDNCDYVD